MKKTLHIILLVLAFAQLGQVRAQQDPMLTQYMSNLLPTNPAYAGSSEYLSATVLSRRQWVGFEGSPNTNLLTVNAPLLRYNMGLGMTLIHDKVGPIQQTLIYVDFAYNIHLTASTKLSFGIKGGANLQQPSLSGLKTIKADDPTFLVSSETRFNPNFGFGLYLYSDRYYVGVSTPKLLKNSFGYDHPIEKEEGGEERHYFVMGGYVLNLSESWKIRPSVFAKMVNNAPPSIDVSAMAIIKDRFWFGSTLRIGDGVALISQYQINRNFRVGYSYDFALSDIRTYNSGTHEVMLSYDLSLRAKKVVNTRFF